MQDIMFSGTTITNTTTMSNQSAN